MTDKLTELIKEHVYNGYHGHCLCGETLPAFNLHAEHLTLVIRQYLQARPLITRPPHECNQDCHQFGCVS